MNRFEYREAQTVQEAVEMMRQEEGVRIVTSVPRLSPLFGL